MPYAIYIFLLSPVLWATVYRTDVPFSVMSMGAGLIALFFFQFRKCCAASVSKIETYTFICFTLILIAQYYIIGVSNTDTFIYNSIVIIGALVAYISTPRHPKMFNIRWVTILVLMANIYVISSFVSYFNLFPDDLALSDIFRGWMSNGDGFAGPLLQANIEVLFMLLSITGSWIVLPRAKNEMVPLISSILPIAAVMASGSRSGPVLLLIIAGISFIASKKDKEFLFSLLLSLIIGYLISMMWINTPTGGVAQQSFISRMSSVGIQARLALWGMALFTFIMHPMLGVGSGNLVAHSIDGFIGIEHIFPSLSSGASMVAGENVWAHNIVLQNAAEFGIIGLLFSFVIIYKVFSKYFNIKIARTKKFYVLLSTSLILTHGMFSISITQGYMMFLFAIFFSYLVRNNKGKSDNHYLTLISGSALMVFGLFTILELLPVTVAYNMKVNDKQFIRNTVIATNARTTSTFAMEFMFDRIMKEGVPKKVWIINKDKTEQYWKASQSTTSGEALVYVYMASGEKDKAKLIAKKVLGAFPSAKHSSIIDEALQ